MREVLRHIEILDAGVPPAPPKAHQRAARERLGRRQTLLSHEQIDSLRSALDGRLLVACFGAGVDSTAMLIALRVAQLRPDAILFADTFGEKPETLRHVHLMQGVLDQWGWPRIEVVCNRTKPSTGYRDLYGNCWNNETLPSLAFGKKSCSIKWKQVPQDAFLRGVTRGPNTRPAHPLWKHARETGSRIVKLIGYDCGKSDIRRAKKVRAADDHFDYVYPLQLIGWQRADCVAAIASTLGDAYVPIKSACYFCPASKQWELYWLAAHHPDLLESALALERRALTGRHSRFDEVEFGASWDELVRTADRFPSSDTTVGLGRSFAWNQWARTHGVVDEQFRVRREQQTHFLQMALKSSGDDNALDLRTNIVHSSLERAKTRMAQLSLTLAG